LLLQRQHTEREASEQRTHRDSANNRGPGLLGQAHGPRKFGVRGS
jgi:hypothetical protein